MFIISDSDSGQVNVKMICQDFLSPLLKFIPTVSSYIGNKKEI